MELTVIKQIKELVDGFKNFSVDNLSGLIRKAADIFDGARQILDIFIAPKLFGAEPQFADAAALDDSALCSKIDTCCDEAQPQEGQHVANFNPILSFLVAQLIQRLFSKKSEQPAVA